MTYIYNIYIIWNNKSYSIVTFWEHLMICLMFRDMQGLDNGLCSVIKQNIHTCNSSDSCDFSKINRYNTNIGLIVGQWKNEINSLIDDGYNLTHWCRVTHMCFAKLTIIGSDNGLSPGRRQAIIWNNARLLLIEPLRTNFSEISIVIQRFSFKKIHLNMSSAKWRPFCLGLNVLNCLHDKMCKQTSEQTTVMICLHFDEQCQWHVI